MGVADGGGAAGAEPDSVEQDRVEKGSVEPPQAPPGIFCFWLQHVAPL